MLSVVAFSARSRLAARRVVAIAGAAAIGLIAVVSPARSVEESNLVITIDRARVVKIPPGTQTLVIGNPIIADVTLLKQSGTMIVTGKGFGETNLIALDASGSPVAESLIQVVGGTDKLVVQRGMDRQSYTCAPRCQPSVSLGDDPKFFGDTSGQIQAHNAQSGQK